MNLDCVDKSPTESKAAFRNKTKPQKKNKFFAEIAIVTFLMGILLSSAVSAPPATGGSATIWSSGTINSGVSNSTIPALHVEGNLIKDSAGNVVVLHGVNKPQMAEDPDGYWLGDTYWNDTKAYTEIDGMRSIGTNCIRCLQSVDSWVYDLGPTSKDPAAINCAISNREAVKRLMTFAAERGMYVIYVPWDVRNRWDGGQQDPLPYPPYQTSENASQVIPNQQAFVDYWANVASVLKDYPNAIFELWNEPNGDATAKASWFNVTQQCINAIRNAGANNLIVIQWDFGCLVNLDAPPPGGFASTLQWIFDYPLTDPTGNLVYSTHHYRHFMHLQRSTGQGGKAYTMADYQLGLQYYKVPEVAALHPLVIGELGCDTETTGLDYQQELEAYTNILQLLNGYGVSYIGWVWRLNVGYTLTTSYAPVALTDAGRILMNTIANAPH